MVEMCNLNQRERTKRNENGWVGVVKEQVE
jgi:hypothetical protein